MSDTEVIIALCMRLIPLFSIGLIIYWIYKLTAPARQEYKAIQREIDKFWEEERRRFK